jgi:glycosyltransferase involved in cell wall biosynthesis
MKLLIITQKIDSKDDNLSFFHGWAEKFSAKLDKLYIVALAGGDYQLPANVTVFSLGKEKGFSKIRQFCRLQKFLFKHLSEVDGVFIHMCPIYAIASFPLTKLFKKRMVLWFTHKSVNWELNLASKLVDKILTASKDSCRIKDRKKIEIVGHGIDTGQFRPGDYSAKDTSKFTIMSAGRMVPAKDFLTLVKAADILINKDNFKNIQIKIIGTPALEEEKQYLTEVKKVAQEKGLKNYIQFLEGVPHKEMPRYYQETDLMINLSHTGSIDKVVLEAMASGCLVLTCNEAFREMLDSRYLFEKKNPQDLAKKIISLKGVGKDENLREVVFKNHNLDNLIAKICQKF